MSGVNTSGLDSIITKLNNLPVPNYKDRLDGLVRKYTTEIDNQEHSNNHDKIKRTLNEIESIKGKFDISFSLLKSEFGDFNNRK
jgi:hypothetical protein